jgi:hypothetical protein
LRFRAVVARRSSTAHAPPTIDEWRFVDLDGGDKHLVGIVCDHPLVRRAARAIASKIE